MAQAPEQVGTGSAPESHEAWANTSKSLVTNAASVTSDLLEVIKGTTNLTGHVVRQGTTGKPRNVDRGPAHAKKIDSRLEVTKTALDSVDGSAQRCAQILGQLAHERQAKWAALKVVEWRLALRERRPKSELFKDHLQESLEAEKKILEDSRQALADRSSDTKVFQTECNGYKAGLQKYLQNMIIFSEIKGFPPESPSNSADGAAAGESGTGDASNESPAANKAVIPTDLDSLINRCPALHEMSLANYFKGEKLIESQRAICERANERTMASFKKRCAENTQLKHGLEGQMREMDEATEKAEKTIARMKKDIEFFGQTQLQPKVDSTSTIVEKLKASKSELAEDLLRKVVSMRIDDCCKKITPERTMQSPDSMPVAALLEGAGTKASLPKGRPKRPPMTKNASSPAFGGANIDSAASTCPPPDSKNSTTSNMRPASPAGLSSSLKAGAAVALSS